MSKLFILVLLALTHREVFAAVICNLCENEKCYWQNGTYYESYAKTCQQKDVDDAYRSLNAAYRQNYSLPTVVDGNYDCLDIVTIFGCVQQGFQARNILPNPAFIKQERRDKFVVCNTNQCNIPFLDGNAFRCNTCNGTEECLKKNLNYVYCESDIPRTYKMLSNHYQKTYQPQYRTKEYECLSINSTLQGSKNSSLVFRGCVEKGFESCNLSFNKDLYKSEDKRGR
uniref:Uncharacterized protein n=1 Tax=Megaselia scalaris TaxID=36166 RepID=T1GIS0_MEGSC